MWEVASIKNHAVSDPLALPLKVAWWGVGGRFANVARKGCRWLHVQKAFFPEFSEPAVTSEMKKDKSGGSRVTLALRLKRTEALCSVQQCQTHAQCMHILSTQAPCGLFVHHTQSIMHLWFTDYPRAKNTCCIFTSFWEMTIYRSGRQ